MAEVASAFVSLLPSARGFGRATESQISGEMKSSGNRLGGILGAGLKVGLLAGAAGAFAGGAFLKGAISQASDLAESTTKIEAIFGKASKSVQSFSDAGARALGQTKLEVLSAASTFGVFGKAAGLSGEDLSKFSTDFVGLSTDLASFNNTTPEQAVEAIGAALRGESEPLRQYGVLLDDATLRNEALKLGLIDSTKEALTPANKVLAAQAAIYKQTGDAQGDFERTSGGLANQQRILAASLSDIKTEIGTALLPVATKFFTFLNDKAVPAISTVASGLGGVFSILAKGDFAGASKTFGFAEDSDAVFFLFKLRRGLLDVADFIKGTAVPAVKDFANALGATLGPVISQISTAFTTQILPALASVGAAYVDNIIPVVQAAAAVFMSELLPAISSLYQAIVANFVPVLLSVAETFSTVIIPALAAFYSYVLTNLAPIFVQVVGIVRDQVVPILASLAAFVVGTLVPAVFKIAQAVGAKLKPVFDQLVSTFRTAVLPALQQILAKFREWQPTIQKVIEVVTKVIGKNLEFAAAILGKVLPPVIKFAGFLISTLVPAILGSIEVTAKIIGKVIEFGRVIVDAVQDVAKFVTGLKQKFGEAVAFTRTIPGKILAALGDIGQELYNYAVAAAGRLISGLVDGIRAQAGRVKDAAASVVGGIKGLLPGSPIKEGPLKNWNKGGAGKRLMDMLAKGIVDGGSGVLKAAGGVTKGLGDKFADQLTALRDSTASTIASLRSEFQGLRDSIASTFSGDLFNVTAEPRALLDLPDNFRELTEEQQKAELDFVNQFNASRRSSLADSFIDRLTGVKANLKNLSAAFKKLVKFGLDPAFLSQLFSSGNGGLILDLAGGSRADARQSAKLFGQVENLSRKLGTEVARNDPNFDELVKQNKTLSKIQKAIDALPKKLGKTLNDPAVAGSKGR